MYFGGRVHGKDEDKEAENNFFYKLLDIRCRQRDRDWKVTFC